MNDGGHRHHEGDEATAAGCDRRRFGAICAVAVLAPVGSRAQASAEPTIRVDRRGELVVIDVDIVIDAPQKDVWAVLTDFERMPQYISSMKTSKVLSREGDSLEVEQSGETRVLFMTFKATGVRGVELVPMTEVRSRMIRGDFKSLQSSTKLAETPAGTRVVHHGEYVPKSWLPPLIGPAVIEGETKRHWAELVAEVGRRKLASSR